MSSSTASSAREQRSSLEHSSNIRLLTQQPIVTTAPSLMTGGNRASGSDLAFQGDLIVAGAYEGVGFFRILQREPYLQQLSFYACPGAQGDVSVWGDYAFVSVENQSALYPGTGNTGLGLGCNNTDASLGQEGLRIIDISDVENPRQVKFVPVLCGSHTHTLVPDGDDIYVYVSSLPNYFVNQVPYCNDLTIVRFPRDDPAQARIVATPDMGIDYGCHDVTVFAPRNLALGACWKRSQLWDISDPEQPEVLSDITNEWDAGHHSAAFTWDGRIVAIGHEGGTCKADSTIAGMALYDVSDPRRPRRVGSYSLPRIPPDSFCWTHNFGMVPTRDDSTYIAISAYYSGGLSVFDLSNPKRPRELAYYVPIEGDDPPRMWGAYWYNGRIYTNDWTSGRGVSVFEVDGLGRAATTFFRERLNPQVQVEDTTRGRRR